MLLITLCYGEITTVSQTMRCLSDTKWRETTMRKLTQHMLAIGRAYRYLPQA
jgi:hypothetical protein